MSADEQPLEPDSTAQAIYPIGHVCQARDQCQEGQWDLKVGCMADIKDTYNHSHLTQQLCEPSTTDSFCLEETE